MRSYVMSIAPPIRKLVTYRKLGRRRNRGVGTIAASIAGLAGLVSGRCLGSGPLLLDQPALDRVARRCGARVNAELPVDRPQVRVHRAKADDEHLSNLGV